ncbi:MAG: DegT/DnrJ/EryC1/StrS family aminotransferase [Phycisphaerae bacterium]|nr:DegT/DnrJ/EryC1/StrS family aminotransferase [Phycisphaerae bacterium]
MTLDNTSSFAPIEMPAVQTRLTQAEEQVLLRVLREGKTLAAGPEMEAFEKEWTAFTSCADSMAVCNGSAALELSAILSGLESGSEVIIPAHTFVSTAVPFARTGASVRWADIDPETRLVTAGTIEPLLSPRTKVIVVVHLYGLTVDMDPIMALAGRHGALVVEDCAQAPGARYKGRRVGSIGDFGCFSFHTHKNITTLGEGGMLSVRDKKHGEQARRLRWMGNWPFPGPRERYWLPAMGDLVEPIPGRWPHNFCMGEPNCAVGRLLIKRIDRINSQRQRQAQRFMHPFLDFGEISFQTVPEGCQHVYHLMSARYDGWACGKTRDDLIQLLHEKYNLKCIVQYWPLHRTELFSRHGFGLADVPETDRFFDNMISFPWWSDMPEDLIDDMAERVRLAIDELRTG